MSSVPLCLEKLSAYLDEKRVAVGKLGVDGVSMHTTRVFLSPLMVYGGCFGGVSLVAAR